MSLPLPLRSRTRGSAILVVIMFTTVLNLLIGSLLAWTVTERRLNLRNALRLESRNAAEALAEFGFSQIRQKFETRSSFSLNPSGSDRLRVPAASFWSGSNVNSATSPTLDRSDAAYVPTATELIGGTIHNVVTGTSSLYYVDPADENNEFDPLKGKWVFRRDVSVIAKATAAATGVPGGGITSYVMEKISVRGAPLFAHAIFYNMDLEIFPGPTMNITGPVHANGNLYLFPDNSLTFTDQVTATGHVYHAGKPGDGADGLTGATRTGSVNIKNRAGTNVNIYGTNAAGTPAITSNVWMDSTKGNGTSGSLWGGFRANASQVWNGNLQTAAHGIQSYTPVAIGSYKEDPTPSNGSDDSLNSGRAIIEPSNYPAATDPSYTTKMEVEAQKYANNAGIYITVTPATSTSAEVITVTSKNRSDPTKNKSLTVPTPASNPFIKYSKYTTTTSGGTTTVTGGMYDQHRSKGLDLVELDIQGLKNAVTEMQKASGTRDTTKAIDGLETTDWTGIVYVEVTGGPTTRIVDDPVTPSLKAGSTIAATDSRNTFTAVRLINGGGKVPSYGTDPGLTIASNAPVYIKGNFNADGAVSTSGGVNPATDIETGELPAAIVSDAISILSANFNDATSRSTANPTATTTSIEISAAFLTGNVPSNKNGTGRTSGGAHNLPRFLENWGSKTVWIRGSMVCLFESRIFTEPHGITSYYSPPNRNWGFSKLFRAGTYPPGTPRVLSYRRIDFTDLTEAQYEAARTSFAW
ncbi:hypothetical protein MASR2M8_12840 [Opitutaceae bacterium]